MGIRRDDRTRRRCAHALGLISFLCGIQEQEKDRLFLSPGALHRKRSSSRGHALQDDHRGHDQQQQHDSRASLRCSGLYGKHPHDRALHWCSRCALRRPGPPHELQAFRLSLHRLDRSFHDTSFDPHLLPRLL